MFAAPLHRYIRAGHKLPWLRILGLYGGLAAFALLMALGWQEGGPPLPWRVAAVAALMGFWWLTEALPLPVTALVPLILFPLIGVADVTTVAAPYAHPVIFLFLGGFLLALAVQRHGLHRRLALMILRAVGPYPDRMVAGFLGATAFLSAWVSNTATATMMLPIALSVVRLLEEGDGDEGGAERVRPKREVGVAIMLSIAFGASAGGVMTLIGTPPNAILAGTLEQFDYQLSFFGWMLVGVPFGLVLLVLSWLVLTRWVFRLRRTELPGARDLLEREWQNLGSMKRNERLVGIIGAITAVLLLARPVIDGWLPEGLSISDGAVALTGAVILFLIPTDRTHQAYLMDWHASRDLPWGVLLLFGGGLSLGAMMKESGLAEAIASALTGLETWPTTALAALIALAVMGIGHLVSRTATAAAFLPLIAALAVARGEPAIALTAAATLAASCTFMLPVGTPPNAIVYASGVIRIGDMIKAGGVLNVVAYGALLLLLPLVPMILS